MNTNHLIGAAIGSLFMLLASHCAAQTASTQTAATPATVANCTMSDGLIEKVRTCQHLDPTTLEVRYTQVCRLTRTIWSDRLELVGCDIQRPQAMQPRQAPQATLVPTTTPEALQQAVVAPAQPCR